MPVTGQSTHAGGAVAETSYADMPNKVHSSVIAQVEYVKGTTVPAGTVIVSKRLYHGYGYVM